MRRLEPALDSGNRVWEVRKGGRLYARLEDARWAEMFWIAYRVVSLTTDPAMRSELRAVEFWHDPALFFVHVPSGAVATALVGQVLVDDALRVTVRGLEPPATGLWRAVRNRLLRVFYRALS